MNWYQIRTHSLRLTSNFWGQLISANSVRLGGLIVIPKHTTVSSHRGCIYNKDKRESRKHKQWFDVKISGHKSCVCVRKFGETI